LARGNRVAQGELSAESRRRLIVLEPCDDLRKVRVDNERALAIVRRREVAADGIELLLNFLVGGIVRNVVLSDLDDELANGTDRLLNRALNGHELSTGIAKRKLRAESGRVLLVLEISNDLGKIRLDDKKTLATVRIRQSIADLLEFRLKFVDGLVVEHVRFSNLDNKLA